MNPAALRILLADDHRIVREGIKQIFADTPDIAVVAEAADGHEVLDRLAQRPGAIDLVLLDIAMPGQDGLSVLGTLRRSHPQLPVLMLSTYPERQYAVRCIQLGAKGYLHKSADPDDMVHAVRQAGAGRMYVSPATAEALALAAGRSQGGQALSHREQQVYRLLTSGLSVGQIGARLGLASNTVSTYRTRILEKTGTRNDVELTLFALNHPSP
ncbi:MAG: response regulator transcription factor [Burkholderiaceae bacterium]|jgi:DNA-binding NarL/FixJ family response regulator|nr:response regulator transcription factor [Burkholderiaceae bacterium]